ncbi:NAD(P)H-dependent oxidoreductase [Virgibacillus dokdonensis]|uniref:NAD(P)H-dependent oxidoreductase n=1 Tax=Virgibacillus dokdonensis TaxID=302167 RepID=A0ABU7VJJ2_9BACI
MTTIILINGSLNPSSNTKKIINLMNNILVKQGYSSKVINVGDLELPLFNPNTNNNAIISELIEDLKQAKGFIIGSPEYHGGYSGALKNFIDYLNSDIFINKPIGLVVLTGGIKSGINTLNSLRIVLRSMQSLVIPQQVAISEKEFIDNNLPLQSKQRILSVIQGLTMYINLINKKHQEITY